MNVPEELDRQIALLLSQNRKVEAVKLVVDTMHCGLKNAKDYVDSFKPGNSYFKDNPSTTVNVDDRLLALMASGNKLEAVKLYKDATGCGLAESKNYVEDLYERGFSTGLKNTVHQQPSPVNRKRDTQIDDLVKNNGIKTKTGCFVATVCYGDYDAAEVLVLRQFRDECLLQSVTGRALVRFYYTVSPFMARQIDRSSVLKSSIRKYILTPMVNRLSKERI